MEVLCYLHMNLLYSRGKYHFSLAGNAGKDILTSVVLCV